MDGMWWCGVTSTDGCELFVKHRAKNIHLFEMVHNDARCVGRHFSGESVPGFEALRLIACSFVPNPHVKGQGDCGASSPAE